MHVEEMPHVNIKLGTIVGEMERDSGISHGARTFLLERLKQVSDEYVTAFCKNCGGFAYNNCVEQRYECPICRLDSDNNPENFGKVSIPYAYKLLIHLLAPFCINLRPQLITNAEYFDNLVGSSAQDDPDIDDAIADFEADDIEADFDDGDGDTPFD